MLLFLLMAVALERMASHEFNILEYLYLPEHWDLQVAIASMAQALHLASRGPGSMEEVFHILSAPQSVKKPLSPDTIWTNQVFISADTGKQHEVPHQVRLVMTNGQVTLAARLFSDQLLTHIKASTRGKLFQIPLSHTDIYQGDAQDITGIHPQRGRFSYFNGMMLGDLTEDIHDEVGEAMTTTNKYPLLLPASL